MKPEIINKNIWDRLKQVYERDQLSGAYLFIGSRGLGKMEMIFNFLELDEKLKNKRGLIESGAHPDVIIVKPEIEEKKGKIREKQISIDQVQEALKLFSYFPGEASNKFLIIDRIEKLTLSAANSLLKTVEELSGNYVVILTASGEGGVLDTIKSRCQRIYFNLKNDKEIEGFIKGEVDFNDDLISDVVFLSRGRIKEAQKIIKDKDYRESRMEKLNQFRVALRGDLKTGFQIANEDTKDKELFSELLTDWIYYLESFLKTNIFEGKDIKIQKKIFQIFKKLNEARESLRSNPNVNARLLLENFFVQIK